jgi:signal transduction histidine kinase
MRRPRVSSVLLVFFVALLAALALLQHRWILQWSRSEEAKRRAALVRSSEGFALDVDRELGHVLRALAIRRDSPRGTGSRAQALARGVELWRAGAQYPDLVQDLWVVESRVGDVLLLFRVEEGGLSESGVWPATLEPVREALERSGARRGARRRIRDPFLATIPAFVLPLPEQGAPPRFLVIRLDADVIAAQILPDVADRRFGLNDEREYDLGVLTRTGAAVWMSRPDLQPEDLLPPDVQIELLRLRDPFGRMSGAGPGRRNRAAPPAGLVTPDAAPGPWELLLRHRSGSIEEVTRVARRRNQAASLGILVLLAGSGALLLVSARRAERVARQQMEFVAAVTHELHTPLAAIRSAGQNLADGVVAEPERVRCYGAMIRDEGRRLSSTVSQVLEFAGIQSGERSYRRDRVSVTEVIDAALRDNALALEEGGMSVERRVAEGLPTVFGDAEALRRAIGNLITNALKFAASGRGIHLRATRTEGDRVVEIRVEDNGPGIAAEDRPRLFEPFYRGRGTEAGRVRGSGLGLSLVAHIVRGHGGTITVEDVPGGGAAFVLRLPLNAPPS